MNFELTVIYCTYGGRRKTVETNLPREPLHADDIVLTAESEKELVESFKDRNMDWLIWTEVH